MSKSELSKSELSIRQKMINADDLLSNNRIINLKLNRLKNRITEIEITLNRVEKKLDSFCERIDIAVDQMLTSARAEH